MCPQLWQVGCGWSIVTRSGGDGKFFYQQPRSGRRFFSAFPPCGGLLLTKKMAALSLSFSPPSVLLHFRFRSRDRDARCSAAYRAPACFFAPFLSPWQTISPLFTSLRGGGEMVSFARGEKEGRGKSRSRLALLATPLSFRMKKSGWNIEPPPLLCERGVSIRPEVVPIFLAITWRASDRIRREERSWNWNFVDS